MGVEGVLFIVLVITVLAVITTMLLAITVAEMLLPVPMEHVLVVFTVVVAAFVIDTESGSLMPKTRGRKQYKTLRGKAGGVDCRYPSPDKITQ